MVILEHARILLLLMVIHLHRVPATRGVLFCDLLQRMALSSCRSLLAVLLTHFMHRVAAHLCFLLVRERSHPLQSTTLNFP